MRRTLTNSAAMLLILACSPRCGDRDDSHQLAHGDQSNASRDLDRIREDLADLRTRLKESHDPTRNALGNSNDELATRVSELDRRLAELETVLAQLSIETHEQKHRQPTSDPPNTVDRMAMRYAMDQFRSDWEASLRHHMYWTQRDVFECYGPPDERDSMGVWKYFAVEGEQRPNLCFVFSNGAVARMNIHEKN